MRQEPAINPIFNPLEHDAVGDGKTLNTAALQRCIDLCHENGGGVLRLPAGIFVTGTLLLKSGVTLDLLPGAVLRASANLDDFPDSPSRYPAYDGDLHTHKTMLLAEGADGIAITGTGTLDGGGDQWKDGPFGGGESFSLRPRILYFRHCSRVQVRAVRMINGATWLQTYQSCQDVVIDGITVDSNENPDIEKERFADRRHMNTDGMDIVDSQQVRISNCFIRAGDDGICLKSLSPDEACRDIIISNCVITTNASGIKIGTESAGAFEDIVITNCVVYDTRCEGISLLTTDGARLERVTISNVSLRNIKGGAIVVKLGNRHRSNRKQTIEGPGSLSDILIQNIQGTRIAAPFACSITGYPGAPVRRIVLENVSLCFDGGFDEEIDAEIPEKSADYPGGRMYGKMPVFGLFIRHAEDIALRGVRLRTAQPDPRPAFRFEDVKDLRVMDCPGAEPPGR